MSTAFDGLASWLDTEAARQPLAYESAVYRLLLDDARVSVTTAEPGRWFPFGALAEVLLWQNRPTEAADLVEATLSAYAADTSVTWPVAAEDYPFQDALLAERLVAPDRADGQRLDRVATLVDPGSVFGQGLEFVREALRAGRPELTHLVSGYENWDELEQPLHPPYDALWAKLEKAKPAEIARLWVGAHASRNISVARELNARFGITTPLWNVRAWFAGWQVRDGDVDGARATLRDAAEHWAPYAMWDVLPTSPVLQPQLLAVACDEFRAETLALVPGTLPWAKKKGRRR